MARVVLCVRCFGRGLEHPLVSVVSRFSSRATGRERDAELEETSGLVPKAEHSLPWGIALRSGNLWAAMSVAACYVYAYFFFQSWFHTYLVKGRGYSENELLLSTLPFLVGACANACGGIASGAMVRRIGLKWGRRSIGLAGLGSATLFTVAVLVTDQRLLALIFLSLIYGGITFQQPAVFAVCLDIGGKYAGAVTGAMNTAAQVGSVVSSVLFGYLVNRYGNYNVPFIPMAILLFVGTLLWLRSTPRGSLLRTRRRRRELIHFIYNDGVNFARSMHALHQDLFDVGGAAGTGDQNHGTGLVGGAGKNAEQFVEIRENARARKDRDVGGRQQRNQPGFIVAGKHDESAGGGEGVIDAGDSDVGGGAGCLQFVAVGEGGVNLRESSDAALSQKRRVRRDGALLNQ
jgi:hypothetical protein